MLFNLFHTGTRVHRQVVYRYNCTDKLNGRLLYWARMPTIVLYYSRSSTVLCIIISKYIIMTLTNSRSSEQWIRDSLCLLRYGDMCWVIITIRAPSLLLCMTVVTINSDLQNNGLGTKPKLIQYMYFGVVKLHNIFLFH